MERRGREREGGGGGALPEIEALSCCLVQEKVVQNFISV